MKRKIFAFLICSLCYLSLYSRPARHGVHTFCQPDGTSFQAKCIGDEFLRIKTTLEGHAIIQDKDGWWCYAEYDSSGAKSSSGLRVGSETSSEAISKSLNIPFRQLNTYAQELRAAGHNPEARPFAERCGFADGLRTRAQGNTTKRALVILAQFNDSYFTYSRDQFVDMLTKDGYDYNGGTGSAKEYFDRQFGGLVEFSFDVSQIVTLPYNLKYYGGNDSYGQDQRPAEMVRDACMLADDHIDFSLYDEDNDGTVDNVFVFFAGRDEAEHPDQEEYIWSHSWFVWNGAGIRLTLDGKQVDSYACTAELTSDGNGDILAGIGTFCHEYGHTLGLPDFYDTNYDTDGWTMGMWIRTSVMDGGNSNNVSNTPPFYNAVERELLGIAQATTIDTDGTYTLEPIYNNKFYRINTETEGEYYLIEYRDNSSWDAYIGGSGMLIYYIDRTSDSIDKWEYNEVNASSDHQCADIIEADKRADAVSTAYEYASKASADINGIFFPNSKTPQVDFTSEISMTNIKKVGNTVTFSIIGYSETTTPPSVTNIRTEAFMDAAIINFESSFEYEGEATIEWGLTGQETQEIKVKPYRPGKYSVTLTGLTPGNKTYSASIYFANDRITGESRLTSFMTSKAAPVKWPYIYIGKNRADEDGRIEVGTKIALMVYNTSEAEDISWTFNEEVIEPEADGYYTVQKSGELKAIVSWEDGSQDIIVKNINISHTE